MSNLKREAAALQLAGYTNEQIADSLGVTPGLISQYQADTTYRVLLTELQAASSVARFKTLATIDKNYDLLEETLTSMLAGQAQEVCAVMAQKPATLNAFMRNLNQMKRRSAGEAASAATLGTVVLDIPMFMKEQSEVAVKLNERNEVVQIDDTPLVAMSNEQLALTAKQYAAEATTKLLSSNKSSPIVPKLDLLPNENLADVQD